MDKMIVSVIGAGSVFTPELVLKFSESAPLTGPVSLRFYDIDRNRQELMIRFCRRLLAARDVKDVEITDCADVRSCLDGAGFVLLQLRQGGIEARINDERLGKKYRLPFTETISICGFATFLRTYYEYERLAPLIIDAAPDAWVLNFTNPAGQLSETLWRLGVKKIAGVCNAYLGMESLIERTLGLAPGGYVMNWRGLNHLTVVDGIYVNGQDRFPELLDRLPDDINHRELYLSLGAVLNGYYQYYFDRREIVEKQQAQSKTRSELVAEIDENLLHEYDSSISIPENLSKRGGAGYSSAVVDIIKAIRSGGGSVRYAVVKNGSSLPGLPQDAFVEVPALVNGNGLFPLAMGNLPPFAEALTLAVKTYERALIKAAMGRDKRGMLESMMIHPLMNCFSVAKPLLDECLTVNAKYIR